jgi:hypothetical protein
VPRRPGCAFSRVKIGVDGAIEILIADAPVVEHDALTAWKATYDARPAQKDRQPAHKRLADGSIRTYFYAWRGGPRLVGEPGCADFVASYNDAIATRPTHHSGKTLATIVDAYLDSQDFTGKRDRTRADYRKITHRIVSEFGDMPIKVVEDRRTRGVFLEWRDRLAKQSKRQADYAFAVLALILAWAKNRGAIDSNPCERAGKVYSAARADKVWREDDEATLLKTAAHGLALAFHLAVWTGQRQGESAGAPVDRIRRRRDSAAAGQDRAASHDPHRCSVARAARRRASTRVDNPDDAGGVDMDGGRLQRVMAKGRR